MGVLVTVGLPMEPDPPNRLSYSANKSVMVPERIELVKLLLQASLLITDPHKEPALVLGFVSAILSIFLNVGSPLTCIAYWQELSVKPAWAHRSPYACS